MIFQSFIKGGTERVNYGYFEYPTGADIIFDFGNPICTSAFNSSRIVYNVGVQNITGSLTSFNNPGPIYPILNTGGGTAGGNMSVQYINGVGGNELSWSYATTENQTSIVVYAPNGGAVTGELDLSPYNPGASSIQFSTQRATVVTTIDGVDAFISSIDTSGSNGRNTWNMVAAVANGTNLRQYWENGVIEQIDTGSIARTTTGNQSNLLGHRSNLKYIAFLQYPRILTGREMRQVYKVFSQRFFL